MQKNTFRGGSMDIFWNCTIDPGGLIVLLHNVQQDTGIGKEKFKEIFIHCGTNRSG